MATSVGKYGLFYAVLFMCTVLPIMAKVIYTVGESSGWRTNVDYNSWVNGKTFFVGDGLVFSYVKGGHTVDEVSESDYNTCTLGNPIRSDSSGLTSVPLPASGTRYFICGVPGHCNFGMKLAVSVLAAPTTTSPPSGNGTGFFPVLPQPPPTAPSGNGTGFFPVPPQPPPCSTGTAPNNNPYMPPRVVTAFSSSEALSPLFAIIFATLVAHTLFLF